MQMSWSVLVFFKKSKARDTKHHDQSREHHHEGTNLDQSCRSDRFIVEKCPMRYESIGSREFDEHSEGEFLVTAIEALRKNLALKCNAKRSGGFSLPTVLVIAESLLVTIGKGDKAPHVKRVM